MGKAGSRRRCSASRSTGVNFSGCQSAGWGRMRGNGSRRAPTLGCHASGVCRAGSRQHGQFSTFPTRWQETCTLPGHDKMNGVISQRLLKKKKKLHRPNVCMTSDGKWETRECTRVAQPSCKRIALDFIVLLFFIIIIFFVIVDHARLTKPHQPAFTRAAPRL